MHIIPKRLIIVPAQVLSLHFHH
uniref:Uncharacterized protein n=1 Tax=Anguilla anguilla TaxID=7936 RepID=A0A0E9RWJ0_ANGAN